MNPQAHQKPVLKPIHILPEVDISSHPRQPRRDVRTRSRDMTVKRVYLAAMLALSLAIVVVGVGALKAMHGEGNNAKTIVSVSQTSVVGTTAIDVPRPNDVPSDNLLIAQLVITGSNSPSVIAPQGWYLIRTDTSARGQFSQSLWYHVTSDAEPASYRFAFDRSASTAIRLADVSGIQPAQPIDAEIGLGSVGVSVTIPSTTTTQAPELLLAFAAAASDTTHLSAPYGMDLVSGFSRDHGSVTLAMARQHVSDSTSTDARTFLSDIRTPVDMVGQVVAIHLAQTQATATGTTAAQAGVVLQSSLPSVSVKGNTLQGSNGQVIQLHGVNRSGTESGCIQGWGIFDGPIDAASIAAMQAWKINAVRLPLNEDCWLGINGVKSEYSGAAYQQAVMDYTARLNEAGIYVILELHWSAPGSERATKQSPMPDRDHAIAFWASVARVFGGDSGAVFDLFNEPFPNAAADSTSAWTCWDDGGDCDGIPYVAAGMQELVNVVRSTGASNMILLGGISYSHDLSGWLSHRPYDPMNNLAASWHLYNFNPCVTTDCWDQNLAPLATQVPLVASEIGEDDCSADFVTSAMTWLDAHGQSYLAWTWDAWGPSCQSMSLIQAGAGAPQGAYGQGVHAYLTKRW